MNYNFKIFIATATFLAWMRASNAWYEKSLSDYNLGKKSKAGFIFDVFCIVLLTLVGSIGSWIAILG